MESQILENEHERCMAGKNLDMRRLRTAGVSFSFIPSNVMLVEMYIDAVPILEGSKCRRYKHK